MLSKIDLKNNCSLFYVESPFQLIQSVEAIHAFAIEKSKIIIRENSSDNNNKQMREIVRILKLNECAFIKCHQNSSRCIFLILRLIFQGYFYKNIYIGDENSKIFRLSVNLINKQKVILMDDGVATLFSKNDSLNFHRFSMFPLGVNTTINTFSHLSSCIGNKNRYKHVIIGMDLISAGICTAANYQDFIIELAAKFPQESDSILYIPHRNETKNDIKVLGAIENIHIKKTRLPIELIGLELNMQPISVSTFFSSAIFSMEKIYPESEFFIYKIPKCKIQKRRNSIEAIYKYIEFKSNFNVINL